MTHIFIVLVFIWSVTNRINRKKFFKEHLNDHTIVITPSFLFPLALRFLTHQSPNYIQKITELVEQGHQLDSEQEQEFGISKVVEHYIDSEFRGRGYISKDEAKKILDVNEFSKYSDSNAD